MKKVVVLECIRSLQNVGVIFRNADGAWFDAIFLTGYTPTPPRKDISKTALGSEKTIHWEYYEHTEEILTKLKEQHFEIIAVETTEKAKDYKTLLYEPLLHHVCLIFWNEIEGIKPSTLKQADRHIMIPMLWMKRSLNVGVAAGIVMFALQGK